MANVWVVTYLGPDGVPIVTVWDNKDAAESHYSFVRRNGFEIVTLDNVPIYSHFELTE